jgi:hypothetical protein
MGEDLTAVRTLSHGLIICIGNACHRNVAQPMKSRVRAGRHGGVAFPADHDTAFVG